MCGCLPLFFHCPIFTTQHADSSTTRMRWSRDLDWSPFLWCWRLLICDLQPCDDCRLFVTGDALNNEVVLQSKERDVFNHSRWGYIVALPLPITQRPSRIMMKHFFLQQTKGGAPPGVCRFALAGVFRDRQSKTAPHLEFTVNVWRCRPHTSVFIIII